MSDAMNDAAEPINESTESDELTGNQAIDSDQEDADQIDQDEIEELDESINVDVKKRKKSMN